MNARRQAYQMPNLVFALAHVLVLGLEQQPLLREADLKQRKVALELPMRFLHVVDVARSSFALLTLVVECALRCERRVLQATDLSPRSA